MCDCFDTVYVLSRVGRGLATADLPSKEVYRLSVRSIISELILNGNRPDSLIHQRRRKEEEEEEEEEKSVQ
jgi:hypothetical protein